MAPMEIPDHNLVEKQVKDVIQDLFQVMVQVSTYDAAGRPSKEVLSSELQTLSESLRTVHTSANSLRESGPGVPDLLVQYVENGRNPDIYTREFVERVRRMNQLSRGKMRAFASFRDVLAAQMDAALPELHDDIRRVVEATGGPEPIPPSSSAVPDPRAGTAAGGSSSSSGGGGGGGTGVGAAAASSAPGVGSGLGVP